MVIKAFLNYVFDESASGDSLDWTFVPSPVDDESVCCSDLSFLEYSTGERNISENVVFSPGPRF